MAFSRRGCQYFYAVKKKRPQRQRQAQARGRMLVAAARRISPVLLSLAAEASTASAFFSSAAAVASTPKSSIHIDRRHTLAGRKFNSVSTSGSPPEAPVGAAAMAKEKFIVAACQILCGQEKEDNIAKAEQAVKNAAAAGAQVSL